MSGPAYVCMCGLWIWRCVSHSSTGWFRGKKKKKKRFVSHPHNHSSHAFFLYFSYERVLWAGRLVFFLWRLMQKGLREKFLWSYISGIYHIIIPQETHSHRQQKMKREKPCTRIITDLSKWWWWRNHNETLVRPSPQLRNDALFRREELTHMQPFEWLTNICLFLWTKMMMTFVR